MDYVQILTEDLENLLDMAIRDDLSHEVLGHILDEIRNTRYKLAEAKERLERRSLKW